jgi:hypothetical protein
MMVPSIVWSSAAFMEIYIPPPPVGPSARLRLTKLFRIPKVPASSTPPPPPPVGPNGLAYGLLILPVISAVAIRSAEPVSPNTPPPSVAVLPVIVVRLMNRIDPEPTNTPPPGPPPVVAPPVAWLLKIWQRVMLEE